jgi:SAM-dependent methyltransferase
MKGVMEKLAARFEGHGRSGTGGITGQITGWLGPLMLGTFAAWAASQLKMPVALADGEEIHKVVRDIIGTFFETGMFAVMTLALVFLAVEYVVAAVLHAVIAALRMILKAIVHPFKDTQFKSVRWILRLTGLISLAVVAMGASYPAKAGVGGVIIFVILVTVGLFGFVRYGAGLIGWIKYGFRKLVRKPFAPLEQWPWFVREFSRRMQLLGIGHGSRVVSIGSGIAYTPNPASQRVPQEWLMLQFGANVEIYEPQIVENYRWRIRGVEWRDAPGKLKVAGWRTSYFERNNLPDGYADAVMMLSVVSDDNIPTEDRISIVQEAIRILKPGGRLVIGWNAEYQPHTFENPVGEETRTENILNVLRDRGYRFIEHHRDIEPFGHRNSNGTMTHVWVEYSVQRHDVQEGDASSRGISSDQQNMLDNVRLGFSAKGGSAFGGEPLQ